MRYPPDDAADQPAARRRSQQSGPGQEARRAGAESSVFVPGYESGRDSGQEAHPAGQGGQGQAPWYGSAAGGAAGRGPVRGYPPPPGQPPPMYPPGQFAAWNRGPRVQATPPAASRPADQPGATWQAGAPPGGGRPAEGSYYGRDAAPEAEPGYSRLAVSDPAADVTSTQTWQAVGDGRATGTWAAPQRSGAGPAGPPAGGLPGGSPAGAGTGQVRGRPGPAGADEPGAGQDSAAGEPAGASPGRGSRLAPWSPQAAARRAALADPLAPGTSPPPGGPGLGAGGPAESAGEPDPAGRTERGARRGSPGPDRDDESGSHKNSSGRGGAARGRGRRGRRANRPDPTPAPAAAGVAAAAGGAASAGAAPAGKSAASRSEPRTAGSPGAGSPAVSSGSPPGSRPSGPGRLAVAGAAAGGVAGGTASRGRSRPGARGKHHGSMKLAIAAGIVLVLAAAGALYVFARATAPRAHAGAKAPVSPAVSASPSASPSPAPSPTGIYGYIASRLDDPAPLTLAQLYPAAFTVGGASFVRTSSRLSKNCTAALTGAGIQGAVSSAGCSQAARATYLSAKDAMMGTIGVLNLRTAQTASKAARHAGATDFISQLPGRNGPTHKIGQGTGIEEAAAKGHYLILMWAELTSLHRPRTAAERAGLERFMTGLLQRTVNVSLTNRMVNGTSS